MTLAVSFPYVAVIVLKCVPSKLIFRYFIIKYCWLLSNAFLCLLWSYFMFTILMIGCRTPTESHTDHGMHTCFWIWSAENICNYVLQKFVPINVGRHLYSWFTLFHYWYSFTESLHYLLLIFIANLLCSVIDLAWFSMFSWLNFSRLCVSINLFLSLSPWCRFSSSLNLILG